MLKKVVIFLLAAAVLGVFALQIARGANPNNGGLIFKVGGSGGSTTGFAGTWASFLGENIWFQSGTYAWRALRIYDSGGSATKYCVQSLDLDADPDDQELGSYFFGATSTLPAGDYTLLFYGWPSNPNCGGGSADLATARVDFGVSGDMPLTISPPVPAISFATPEDATSTLDFPFWDLHLENTTSSYWIEVKYGLVSSTPAYSDKALFSWNIITDFRIMPKSQSLIYPPLVDGITWYAQAFAYPEAASTTIAASSTQISFQVHYPGGGVSSTSTIASSTITCDSGNGIADGFCGIFVYLFYPSQQALTNFSYLSESVKDKPPFGYFTSAYDLLSGLQNGTSSIELMDASTTAALSGIFTPLRTGLAWIFWFIMAWWLFHRIRKIEL